MSVLQNLNYIAELEAMPCASPDPLVYIQTGLQAAPPALLQLLVPGCSEIVQARLGINPLAGKGTEAIVRGAAGFPQRRGQKHGKRATAHIQQIHKPLPLGGKQFLYKTGFFAIQKALLFWQIVDVSTDFIATWSSLIRATQGCDLPAAGYVSTGIAPLIFPGPGVGYLSFGSVARYCADIRLQRIRVDPGSIGAVGYHMEWEPWPDPSSPKAPVTTWLEQTVTGTRSNFSTTDDPVQKNGNRTGGFKRVDNLAGASYDEYKIGFSVGGAAAMRPTVGNVGVQCYGNPHTRSWGCNLESVSNIL